MKKIFQLIIIFLLAPALAMAQGRIAEIWSQPAVFIGNEQVSIFFDITGTELASVAEEQGVCVWTWYPADPGDAWGNPSDKTKLKHVSGNIWRWDLNPAELYKVEASSISALYGQLQTHKGEKQALFAPDQDPPNHIQLYSLNAIKADETIIDIFPKQFSVDKPVSVLVNTNHTYPDQCGDNPVLGELAGAPNVHVHGGVNNWTIVVENNPANVNKTALTHLGDGIYRWDFIPKDYFGLANDFVLTNISAVFASNNWAYIGKNTGCTDFFIDAPEIPDMPVPDLVFFPSKISRRDLLTIIRSDNEPYVSAMDYTITAGNKILKGSFTGTNKTLTAYINLADELKDAGNPEKIHVQLKDNTGRIVSSNDLQLVPLNQ